METKVQGPVSVDGIVTMDGFEGFGDEDIAFGATEMFSSATMLTTNNFPRLSLPNAVDTSVFVGGFNFPIWYENSGGVDIHIGWTNEGADVVGNVLFAWNVRQVNIGQAMSAGTLISTGFNTFAPPANGFLTVTQLDLQIDLVADLGFGYVLGVELARLGTQGADTIANAIGLCAIGFKHNNT
jgi:hypothetical protein